MTTRESLKGKGVLITGGAGFIGSHLVDRILTEGAREVIVVDSLFVGSEENLKDAMTSGRIIFYRDDVELPTSLEYVFERHSIDAVFNASTKPLNYSFLNPANAFSSSVTMVLNLLELQRRGAFKTLCHFSTSEVYGSAVYEPIDEAHPWRPTTAYAGGKAAADYAVANYVDMFGADAFIVRPFNNYGQRQNWRGMLAAVLPITIWRILNGHPPEIHGDGSQSREFIYVHDTVDAIVQLYSVLPAGDAVNISTDNCLTIADLIGRVCKQMGYTGEVVRKPARASDVLSHKASNLKVRQLIDFQFTPFEKGLRETIGWYRKRHNSREF